MKTGLPIDSKVTARSEKEVSNHNDEECEWLQGAYRVSEFEKERKMERG